VVVVIRTDDEKHYIDLSKRRVSSDDVAKCEEKYNDAKTVNQILRHTSELLGYDNEAFEGLYNKTAWHFDRKAGRSGAAFEVFKKVVVNPDLLDECELDEKTKEVLHNEIKRRLMPQAVKIRADFEVSCFSYEGIDAIKKAIRAGLAHSTEELPIQIHLIAPPTFYMTTQTMDRNEGFAVVNKALQSISDTIQADDGKFNLIAPPKVISDHDERELKNRLAELEEANREVSGDESNTSSDEDDSDEDDDEGPGKGDVKKNGTE
jgi:translation initiation factor 2 subunit 1